MPDPTFSLRIEDFYASESAGQRVAKIRAEAGRMIALLVSVRNDLKTLEIIKALKISGYTTVSLSSSHSEADFDLADQAIDPIEWASLLGSVDLVITERFHGAVFAIRGNTPVIALGYRNQRSLAPSKLLDLFARFDISNYFFDMSTWSPAVLKRFEKLLDISIWPNKLVNDRASNFSSKLEVFGSELAKLFGPNSAL
jgi:polysaccharide pyruvyl transferase WcaK-like protein